VAGFNFVRSARTVMLIRIRKMAIRLAWIMRLPPSDIAFCKNKPERHDQTKAE
jgi:hypothetical protein